MAEPIVELDQEQDGVAEGVETQQPSDATADPQASRQPKKVNLDEFAEFREWKAKTDKRLEQERLERIRLEQHYQRQLDEERRRVEAQQLSGMDDYQRTEYEKQKAIERAEAAERMLLQVQQQTDRQRALTELINEYQDLHGVTIPATEFDEVTTPAEAYRVANRYVREIKQEQAREQERQSATRQQEREQKRQANRVDTGRSAAPPLTEDVDRQLAAAYKSGDVQAYMRLLRESRQRN